MSPTMPDRQEIQRLVPEREAAAVLHLSPRTLQRWRWMGRGPLFIKLDNGAVRYEIPELHRFIESGRRASTSDR